MKPTAKAFLVTHLVSVLALGPQAWAQPRIVPLPASPAVPPDGPGAKTSSRKPASERVSPIRRHLPRTGRPVKALNTKPGVLPAAAGAPASNKVAPPAGAPGVV